VFHRCCWYCLNLLFRPNQIARRASWMRTAFRPCQQRHFPSHNRRSEKPQDH
jgi:hypothetical protein